MKTLQEQYQLIKEGKGRKDLFIRQALRQFPNILTKFNTYNEVVTILKGKQVIFLANLEPKELRGELSQGMILAAVEGDELSVLTTDRKVPNNAKVQ